MFICTVKSNDIQVIQVERRKYSSITQYLDATCPSTSSCDRSLVGRSQNLQLEAEKHTRWLRPQQTLMTRIYAMIKLTTTGVQWPAGLRHLSLNQSLSLVHYLAVTSHHTSWHPGPQWAGCHGLLHCDWSLHCAQAPCSKVFQNTGWDQNWVVRSSVGCHIIKKYEQ